MVAVTYGSARGAAKAKSASKSSRTSTLKNGKSFVARVFDSVAQTQMIRAERELARHRHLLPPEFDTQFRKYWTRGPKDEPFGGW